jgi:macrolide transport system ATP-binding/permease protein
VMQALLRLIPKQMMASMPFLNGLGLNLHIVLFTVTIAAMATVLFAVTPLVRLPTRELQGGLSEGGRGAAGTLWRRLGSNMVVAELAIAMVLLVGAGLLGKSLYRLLHVEIGFQPNNLATLTISGSDTVYGKAPDQVRLAHSVVDRLDATPGVESAALTSTLPVSYNGNTDWIRYEGRPYHGEHNEVLERDVTPDYFKTLGAKLLRGRGFSPDDDANHPNVAIINKAMARRDFGNADPVGKRLGNLDLNAKSMKTIVGVVDGFREGPLDEDVWPAIYYPMYQSPDNYVSAVVRTKGSDVAMLPALTAAVHAVDPDLGVIDQTTMNLRIQESQTAYMHRSATWMVGSFAALAALLGVVGLYGVVAYSVGQRTREIGVRMALGAQPRGILWLVLRRALIQLTIGLPLGIAGALGVGRILQSILVQTGPKDVTTLASIVLILILVAVAACLWPARRAAAIHPVIALRGD